MTAKISAPLQSLLKALIHEELPRALDAAGLASDAASLRPAPLDSSAEAGLKKIRARLPKKTSPSILEALDAAIAAMKAIGGGDEVAVAKLALAGLEATDGELVRGAIDLYRQDRGGAARLAAMLGKNKSVISRVAVPGAGIKLAKDARARLLDHLRDPERNPLPAAPKPGPTPSRVPDLEKPLPGDTVQLRLTPEEKEAVWTAAEQHDGGMPGWLEDAIRGYASAYASRPPVDPPPIPAKAKRCSWKTNPDALLVLDKAIGGGTRASHIREAVLRAAKGSR